MAMYRCEAPNGTVSFQDRHCPEGSKEQGVGQPAPAPLVAGPDDKRRAEQIRSNQDASSRALRKTQLERTELPAARAALTAHRSACQKEIADLRMRRDGTSNRFPGQQQALGDQQRDAQARCDTQGRELADRLETLQAECAALQCSAHAGN